MTSNVINIIEKAIKQADSGIIFEDYNFQAKNVIKKLNENGYIILPTMPDDDMIQAGKDAVFSGRIDPKELIINIYTAMLEKFKK